MASLSTAEKSSERYDSRLQLGSQRKGKADFYRDAELSPDSDEGDTKVYGNGKNYGRNLEPSSTRSSDTICSAPGLVNLGNTCYFNSVVQVLYHILPFREALVSWQPFPGAETNRFSLTKALKRLFQEMGSQNRMRKGRDLQPISPNDFLNVLRDQNGDFSGYGQQDAQEFLRFLLDKVNDAFRESAQVTNGDVDGRAVKRRKQEDEKNAVQRVFEGCSLSWTFSQHMEKERLSGANKYHCEFCMAYTEADRWWQLHSLPPVMTIHLKLFAYGKNVRGKVSSTVQCPQNIVFQRWCDSEDENTEYKLEAVIVHEGSTMSSGHYYAYVNENGWFCFDDADVTAIDEEELKRKLFPPIKSKKTAYLLFYRGRN